MSSRPSRGYQCGQQRKVRSDSEWLETYSFGGFFFVVLGGFVERMEGKFDSAVYVGAVDEEP